MGCFEGITSLDLCEMQMLWRNCARVKYCWKLWFYWTQSTVKNKNVRSATLCQTNRYYCFEVSNSWTQVHAPSYLDRLIADFQLMFWVFASKEQTETTQHNSVGRIKALYGCQRFQTSEGSFRSHRTELHLHHQKCCHHSSVKYKQKKRNVSTVKDIPFLIIAPPGRLWQNVNEAPESSSYQP